MPHPYRYAVGLFLIVISLATFGIEAMAVNDVTAQPKKPEPLTPAQLAAHVVLRYGTLATGLVMMFT